MGQFLLHPEVFERFPGLRIAAAVALGLDNTTPRPAIEADWERAWREAMGASTYGNAQSHPRIQPWREGFTRMGVSGKQFPSSAEALLRRALKGGEPFRINPLVDWYNTISLRHLVPAGGFDLDDVSGPVELRLSRRYLHRARRRGGAGAAGGRAGLCLRLDGAHAPLRLAPIARRADYSPDA